MHSPPSPAPVLRVTRTQALISGSSWPSEECPPTRRGVPCPSAGHGRFRRLPKSSSPSSVPPPREGFPGQQAEKGRPKGQRRGSRADSQNWSAPGSMPATPISSCVSCHPQHGAALQPRRLKSRDLGSQYGQQHRQPPSQGQGVQPAPQPGAHGELTAGPPGPHCLLVYNQKRGRHTGQASWVLLAPLSSPGSWAREAAPMPEAWLSRSARSSVAPGDISP